MTCTYGFSHFRHFQNCCNRNGNTNFKYMNYVPIIVATDLEVHFSVLKKGVSQYFCLYSVCTSHWCLVMSFWLKVCIYSHTRGVQLGLGLGFMQTSQGLYRIIQNYTGFPGDVCVAFFNVPPGNKDAVTPNPLTKEESRRVYKCDDKRLSGSNKCWIFKSMWNI